ncbi:MAG: hypothetical protein ACR2JB_06625 [Bryobacteraceae bacterium]
MPMALKAHQSAREEPLRAVLAAHAVPLQGAGEALLLSESRTEGQHAGTGPKVQPVGMRQLPMK